MERKNTKYDDITYPIYHTLYREYEMILERGRAMDARAGLLVAALLLVFPLYLALLGIERLGGLLEGSSVVDSCLFVTVMLAAVLFLVALLLFLLVLCRRKYMVFNHAVFKGLNIVEYEDANTTVNDVNVSLIDSLHDKLEYNSGVLRKKALLFSSALWVSFAYVVLTVVSVVLLML